MNPMERDDIPVFTDDVSGTIVILYTICGGVA